MQFTSQNFFVPNVLTAGCCLHQWCGIPCVGVGFYVDDVTGGDRQLQCVVTGDDE